MKQLFTFKSLIMAALLLLGTLVNAQEISALYLVGDVIPSGWSIGDPTPMNQDAENAKLFTWEGALSAGELKISTFKGDWCDGQWLNAAEADQPISTASYLITNGCDGPDNKWRVQDEESGIYLISIDLDAETIVFEQLSDELSDVTLASLSASVGALTPEFDVATSNYTLTVPEGTSVVEITATTTDSDATVEGAGVITLLGDSSVQILITGADNITTATCNINIIIETAGEVYSNLYMVGDATPAGWNIAEPEPMTQDADNPKLFTWEGPLVPGEFKFPAFKGDWCDGDWLLAMVPDQTITEGEYQYTVYTGCAPGEEDFKWRVQDGEEGDYLITVDLENELINIEAIEPNGVIDRPGIQFALYPNPAQSTVTLKYNGIIQSLEIATISGRIVRQLAVNQQELCIDISSLANGVYLVKTSDEFNTLSVQKLVIQK